MLIPMQAEHFDLICNTLIDMYLDLPPASPGTLPDPETQNATPLTAYLRSPIFQHMYYNLSISETQSTLRPLRGNIQSPHRKPSRKVINPLISRLHVLLSPDFFDAPEQRNHRGFLREAVYSSTNYGEYNDWGPFTSDGKVDWTLVDAIGSVMSRSFIYHMTVSVLTV